MKALGELYEVLRSLSEVLRAKRLIRARDCQTSIVLIDAQPRRLGRSFGRKLSGGLQLLGVALEGLLELLDVGRRRLHKILTAAALLELFQRLPARLCVPAGISSKLKMPCTQNWSSVFSTSLQR